MLGQKNLIINQVNISMSKHPKLLLIAGHPRSGTTLLKKICHSHPDIVVTGELNNFSGLGRSYLLHLRRLRKNVWRKPLFGPGQLNSRRIKSLLFLGRYIVGLLPYWGQPIEAEMVRVALGRACPQTPIVGDKKPRYIWKLPELVQIENAAMVIIYRDCRDVVQSMLRKVESSSHDKAWLWARHLDTAEKVAQNWVEAIELMEAYRGQIHIIRYEELVTNPGPVLAQLGAYLQVDPAGFDQTLIKTTSIGKHKNYLNDEQLAAIDRIAGETMKRLDYNQPTNQLTNQPISTQC